MRSATASTVARVLVVDDAEINQIAFRAVLSDLAQIATASSGEEAVRLVQNEEFAVVLLDVMMPGLDGFETLRRIRQTHFGARTPVIFITASQPDDDRIRLGYSLGAADYLYKPVLADALRAKVGVFVEILRQRRRIEEQEELTRRSGIEKLRESEMRLRIALDTGGLGAWDIDLRSGAMDCTPRCREILGIHAELNFSYQELLRAIHSEDREKLQSAVKKALAEHADLRGESRVVWADGSEHWILTSGRGLYNSHGEAVRMVGVTVDITERRKAELELRERTEELVRSNTELNQFAYVVSHDLKEPLRMVTSYVQLLERRYREKLDKDAADYIGFAVEGAGRMYALLNDLLDYSRLGVQKSAPIKPIEVNQVVHRALSDMQVAIQASGAHIVADDMPTVIGDATQLYQVFQNLIANGLKFQRGPSPRMHLGVEDTGDKWRFFVSDNGIGIDSRYHDRIFTLFQRLHTRGDFPGTGIGLAICKKIVERHGGQIWVESEEGEGATFYFTLPKPGPALASENDYCRSPVTAERDSVSERLVDTAKCNPPKPIPSSSDSRI